MTKDIDSPTGQDLDALLEQALADPQNQQTLIDALMRLAAGEEKDRLAGMLARILPQLLDKKYFTLWQEHGFHILPNQYVSPIPDTRTLSDELWRKTSDVVGVDFRDADQIHLLRDVFPRFRAEYERFPDDPEGPPHRFCFHNQTFSGTDALVLFCMVRHLRPSLIVEVGSGFSTRMAAEAARRNGDTRLVSIEPYPEALLRQGFPGLDRLIDEKVEEVDPAVFEQLGDGDVLFIDSSHVVRIGGDVNYLYFEVVPRLAPGVVVHIHDVFLPNEYPRPWIMDEHWFWSEQYLVRAFLSFNSEFEVLFANSYMETHHPEDMRRTFPGSPWWGGGSLWLRRKPAPGADSGGR